MKTTLQLLPIRTKDPDYAYCEQLYISAFPPAERRNTEQQHSVTDNNPRFRFCALRYEHQTVGFLSYWDLDTFIYIEHFAVDVSMRGKSIGSHVLQYLHKHISKPVILEVEHPETDIAKRRIRFYERCGYTLWKSDYLQPPYQKGYAPLPLYLMCHGHLTEANDFNMVKETLYKEVYNLCND